MRDAAPSSLAGRICLMPVAAFANSVKGLLLSGIACRAGWLQQRRWRHRRHDRQRPESAAAAPVAAGSGGDPIAVDYPVFYVKRPVPDPEDDDAPVNDARELIRFEIGADLYTRPSRLALGTGNQS